MEQSIPYRRLYENGWENPLRHSRLRNLPCPCQSGKKAKKCCGRPELAILNQENLQRTVEAVRRMWARK